MSQSLGNRQYGASASPSKPEPQSAPTGAQDFRGGRKPSPTDVFIAVMGVTGSGKSSFIQLASGSQSVKIGHNLESCTSRVEVYAYTDSAGKTIYLIDTPGFDDTNLTDVEVLQLISDWMKNSCLAGVLLHGLIYIHRISDARMQGSAKDNLVLFRKICGDRALERVILVTTMWDTVIQTVAEKRQQELIDTPSFWGDMIQGGSQCRRHMNTKESAQAIIRSLSKENEPVKTQIQHEMVDEKRDLPQTTVGVYVDHNHEEERQRWAKKIEDMEKERRDDRERDRKEFERERELMQRRLDELEQRSAALHAAPYPPQHHPHHPPHWPAYPGPHQLMPFPPPQHIAPYPPPQHFLQPTSPSMNDLSGRMAAASLDGWSTGAGICVPEWTSPSCQYSLSLSTTHFVAASDEAAVTLGSQVRTEARERDMDFVTCGIRDDGRSAIFLARYTNDRGSTRWHKSQHLDEHYPELDDFFELHGGWSSVRKSIDYAALGPDGSYYIRLDDGAWSARPRRLWEAINQVVNTHEHEVHLVSLGYESTFFIVHGPPEQTKNFEVLSNFAPHQYIEVGYLRRRYPSWTILALGLAQDGPLGSGMVIRNEMNGTCIFGYTLPNDEIVAAAKEWWEDHCNSNKLRGEPRRICITDDV